MTLRSAPTLQIASGMSRASVKPMRFGTHDTDTETTVQGHTELKSAKDVAALKQSSKRHDVERHASKEKVTPPITAFTKNMIHRHTNGMKSILGYLGKATAILEDKETDLPNKMITGIGLLLDLVGVLSLPVPFLHGAVILSPAFWSYASGFVQNPNKVVLAHKR
ncbi:MAG: hypothetical protein ACKO37_04235 [Vampirovibrionales bacterium]